MKKTIFFTLCIVIIAIITSYIENDIYANDTNENNTIYTTNTNEPVAKTNNNDGFISSKMSQNEFNDIIAHKNTAYEMNISNENIDEEIAKTYVRLHVTTSQFANYFSGNIYDIDDDYIYILTCKHPFTNDKSTNNELVYEDFQSLYVIFPNDEKVTIDDVSYIRFAQNDNFYIDLGIVAIPKYLVSQDCINSIKTIHFDYEYYQKDIRNTQLHTYFYSYADNIYKTNNIKITKYLNNNYYVGYDYNATNPIIECGYSGGGLFFQDGTYAGFVVTTITMHYYQIPQDVFTLIKDINPNY